MEKTCIVIAGPTAVGKTSLSIQLAKRFSTQIISADSRQCYCELNIGVAKPSAAELEQAKHYFINSHSIQHEVTAADFETYALQSIEEIFAGNDMAIMVGGSGLYIKAFVEGLDAIPPVEEAVRLALREEFEQSGNLSLQNAIAKEDPQFFAKGEIQNPQRLMRALEVKRSTGRSIFDFRNFPKKQRNFRIIQVALQLPREVLYERINMRVDQMIDAGLVEEARGLFPNRHLNALQTVGYRELFDFFEGALTLDQSISLIKQNSRHYAKRQITWFKKQEGMLWCSPVEEDVLQAISSKIAG